MHDSDVARASIYWWGSNCAFVAGACFLVIAACALAAPATIASYVTSDQYFKDFAAYESTFTLLKGLMLVANGALVGVVCSFYVLHRPENAGLMIVFSVLAIIGLGVGMLQAVQDMTVVPRLADQYAGASAAVKETIIAIGVSNPAIYLLSLGLPGLWFILVSIRALDNPRFPKLLVGFGILWGVGNLLTVIAHLFVIVWMLYFVALGALLAAPIWSIWEGVVLRRLSREFPDADRVVP